MKKTKKFDDGGPTGGHWQSDGDGRSWVADAPVADVPVAASIPAAIGLRGGRPMGGGLPSQMDVLPARLGRTNVDYGQNLKPIGRMLPSILSNDPQRGVGGMAAMKKGGAVKKMAKGGSASSRADGCAIKGKTKGRFV